MAKIFYAVNGVGATTTLINVNNMNLQASCTGNFMDLEINTQINDSEVAYNLPAFTVDNTFDTGDTFNLPSTDALFDFSYANPVGQLVSGQLEVNEGPNEVFTNVDCKAVGFYVAL